MRGDLPVYYFSDAAGIPDPVFNAQLGWVDEESCEAWMSGDEPSPRPRSCKRIVILSL
tara:strand:+ start:802 stop:975 length:174 start_codon:yes stop_codon:yes gene_type:complete